MDGFVYRRTAVLSLTVVTHLVGRFGKNLPAEGAVTEVTSRRHTPAIMSKAKPNHCRSMENSGDGPRWAVRNIPVRRYAAFSSEG
jgi:hypothetical protein